MVHTINIVMKLFENNYVITNSRKTNNQTDKRPKRQIGTRYTPKAYWSFNRKLQLSRQISDLPEDDKQMAIRMLRVSGSYIMKTIQFKLLNL